MKKALMGLVLSLGVAVSAQAGFGPFIVDVIFEDNGDGSTTVEGSLVGVRFTEVVTQQIGCRVAAVAGGPASVACVARDLNEVLHGCFSFDPALIEAAKSISPYSYVNYRYDNVTNECQYLLVSVRSHHIPDKFSEKGKEK